jgi:hypothetical protein
MGAGNQGAVERDIDAEWRASRIIRKILFVVAVAVVAACVGYQQGFRRGADAALCAVLIELGSDPNVDESCVRSRGSWMWK